MQQGATTLVESQGNNLQGRCEVCGGSKPKGRGVRVCAPCKERRRKARREEVRKNRRHPCERCGADKGSGHKPSIYCVPCGEWVKTHCRVCGGPRKSNHCPNCERGKCLKCGGEKPPGHGVQFCVECHALEKWRNQKRARLARKRVRYCVECSTIIRNKNLKYCAECKTKRETRLCTNCKVNPSRGMYKKFCEPCHLEALERAKEYHRVYRNRKWHTDPEWRAKQQAYRIRYRKNRTVKARRYLNESARLRYRIKKDIAPIPIDKYRQYNQGNRKNRYAVSPLIPFIERVLRTESIKFLADKADIDEAVIRRCLKGEQVTLRLEDADNLCMAMGLMLDNVYVSDIDVRRGAPLEVAM